LRHFSAARVQVFFHSLTEYIAPQQIITIPANYKLI